MKSGCSIIIRDQEALLLADKALYWPQYKTLLIADVHFGKAAAYRALGQPVPQGTTSNNIHRLDNLLARHVTEHLIFLGDFLHAPKSHAPATLSAIHEWRLRHAQIKCTLIRGNHDARAGDPPSYLDIDVVTEPFLFGEFALQHIPKPHATHHVIAGHVHPVFRLMGKGRQRVVLPCFAHDAAMTLLPSFGAFTGGYAVDNYDRIFVTDGDYIWPVSPENSS